MLTDTHSHLYADEFDADRDQAIARAQAAGIGLILLPAIDADSYERQEALAASHPHLFRQMMGLHPTSVDANWEQALATARQRLFAQPDKYVGIGEIGLDFYWDTTFRTQQLEALQQQMEWAVELGKPIVLHLRSGKDGGAETDAYAEMFRQLALLDGHHPRGIMHCFSGTPDDARKAVDMGFLIGIGGTLTYKKSTLPDIVRALPIGSIVLETDDPYLAPVPHRGKRNEPAFMLSVAEKLAEIKALTTAEVAAITTANALRLFDLGS